MAAAILRLLRLMAALTAISITAVGISVALVATARSAEQGSSAGKASTPDLAKRAVQRRAVEAVIWGMPAVNFDLLYQAMAQAKGSWNQVVYWSRLPDWKNQTLTPNPDVIYVFPFFDTKDVGPMVMEIPPAGADGSITGSIDDGWQTALEDVGPAGVDKGNGGKYLILPPGYKGTPPTGYIALPSPTYRSYAILRSNPASGSDADVAKAAAYGKRVKIYPLSQAAKPPPTTFVDAIDVVYDSTIPYDLRFFQALDRFVQHEPWIDRDRAMIDMLKSIGIEKGKTFDPDPETQAVLKEAIGEARAWLDNRYEDVFTTSFNAGKQWVLPALPGVLDGMATNFSNRDAYPVDGRSVAYSMAYFSAKHLGAGQYYLMTIRDKDRKPLDGSGTYRLNVPANAPVKLYWSATVYDRATHALIRGQPWSSRSSNTPKLARNADGSVDVFFAPIAPPGKEANWVPTEAGGRFEVLFRFYGPQKALFDKTWVLPDIENISRQSAGTTPSSASSQAQSQPGGPVPVTIDTFTRAETDTYMAKAVKEGGVGKLYHRREPARVDDQVVIRINRDTLYSSGVFDLDAGPVTITLPDAGKRFMSLEVINQDHYAKTFYGGGPHAFTRKAAGTRYILVAVRTLVDPDDPMDVRQVHALQNSIEVNQRDAGTFQVPNWNQTDLKNMRAALLELSKHTGGFKRAFGTKDEVDPVRHLIATAAGWGGNPDKDATYLSVTPANNDGATVYRLGVKDVPVDAFWSITVYNAKGYLEPNKLDAYSLNSITAKKSGDGTVSVQFGGCDGKIANCLPTTPGWNYTVRLYRPRAEILDGTWKFPEARPVEAGSRALQ